MTMRTPIAAVSPNEESTWLVPVWLVTYRYGRKSYQVAVNGYTGVVAGERPYSVWKILGAVLAVLAVLGLLWLLLR